MLALQVAAKHITQHYMPCPSSLILFASIANEHAVQGTHLLGAGLGAGLALGLSSGQGSTLDGSLIASTNVVGVLHTGVHTHAQLVGRGHLL